jgi:outer membrane protein TolC
VIALSGGAGYASKYLPPDGSTWNIGITLTIPVFTGMNTSSQIRETLALERMADARLKDLYLQVATEIEAAWRSAKEVDLRYLATEKAKMAAQEQSRLALERYRQGVGSMIEASDAQLQAYRAENEQIVTDFERSTARAVFARALGQTRLSSGGKE